MPQVFMATENSPNPIMPNHLHEKRLDRRLCVLLVVILGVYYGALQNGRWVPNSDADLYISIARSFAQGKNFVFNGAPVRLTPPGWPLFLAAASKVSARFWFLNLINMCMVIGAAGLYYRIVRTLVSPRRAFIVCLTVGILYQSYINTYFLLSEGLLCIILATSLLLSLQISENRPAWWRIPLLLVLCALLIIVRWAGILAWFLIAAALLSNQVRLRLNRQWVSTVLAGMVIASTFVVLRYAVKNELFIARQAEEQNAKTPDVIQNAKTPDVIQNAKTPDVIQNAKTPDVILPQPMYQIAPATLTAPIHNFLKGGSWFSELLCKPVQLGQSAKSVRVVANCIGWVLFGLFLIGTVIFLRRRKWLLLGALLYCLTLFIRWPHSAPRYLIPVAPLLFLGLWEGINFLQRVGKARMWKMVGRGLLITLFAGIAICNLSLYAVDVAMIHSRDFYGTFYAGEAKPLISIAAHLRTQSVKDWEVASSSLDYNLGLKRGNRFGHRGLCLLLDKAVVWVPSKQSSDPPDEKMDEWLREKGVKYYVYRPQTAVWRVWHFHMPWLQEKLTGKPAGSSKPYYELYKLNNGKTQKVDVPESHEKIERIIGL